MTGHDIIVIGGSSGSFIALQELLPLIPAGLPASLFIVIHRAHLGSRALDGDTVPQTLAQYTDFRVVAASNGRRFESGHIYIGPPACHLFVERDFMRVDENLPNPSRGSIDGLFLSAAVRAVLPFRL